MPDWRAGMEQTYEYYVVDPNTWRETYKLDNVVSCTISRDTNTETLGSASFKITDTIGEDYVRVYLVTIQNGQKERHCLGTFLIQTPSSSFNGKVRTVSVDAYTPLLELKESVPPIGYSLYKETNVGGEIRGTNIMDSAYQIVRDRIRAPVVKPSCDTELAKDFVANVNDTWSSFVLDLIANAKYHFELDEMGRVLFAPDQDAASLQPIWTFDDGNSSILYADITMDHDLYGIPNVVEVVCASDISASGHFYARVVNDDPNSPTSTVRRGREIVYRDSSPSIAGNPSQEHVEQYARQLLRKLSSVEYTLSYTHGYCPVRLGDCVRLDYASAGIRNVKARVISQSISCEPGCPVSERAVFTTKLWG